MAIFCMLDINFGRDEDDIILLRLELYYLLSRSSCKSILHCLNIYMTNNSIVFEDTI